MSLDLFDTARVILDALEFDYAGMPECSDGNRSRWEDVLGQLYCAGALNDELFWKLLSQRIACLGDRNVSLLPGAGADFVARACEFEVRRQDDVLWVVWAPHKSRLSAGDAIVALDGLTPSALLQRAIGNPAGSDVEERQHWDSLLACSSSIDVRHADGTVETIPTPLVPMDDRRQVPCSFSRIDDGTCVLVVGQLDDLEAAALVVEHAQEIRGSNKVVLDLRSCTGGIEQMAYPLLNLLFDEPTNLKEVLGSEEVVTLYTQSNCTRREEQIAQLKALLATGAEPCPDETLAWMDENLAIVASARGNGPTVETAQCDDLAIAAGPAGQRVVLLIDTATADAAEWLARIAKHSSRSTIVGRATSGNLDYSNPVTITFEDKFVLTYPMSKTTAAVQGQGVRLTGILPDVHVPFTEQECTRDLILERALQL